MTNFAVRVWFERTTASSQTVHGRTDNQGVFTAEGRVEERVAIISDEPGWYPSRAEHNFYHYKDFSNIVDDRWLPWNPTNTIVVREKRNPVEMFNPIADINVIRDIPQIPLDEPIGFDCEQYDWLPPHGTGTTADFTVEITSTVNGTNELRLAAVDEGGGFIVKPVLLDGGSRFVTEYEAPETGYEEEFILSESWIPTIVKGQQQYHRWCSLEEPQYIVFRSRVRKDASGQITNATHGIIFADRNRRVNWAPVRCFESIRWLGDENGQRTNGFFSVEYRFNSNPTSRSIEWDRYELWSGVGFR